MGPTLTPSSSVIHGAGLAHDLIIGAIGSLIATVIWAIATYLLTRRFRKKLVRFALRSLGVGVDCIYENQDQAQADIIAATNKASRVLFLGMRGRSLIEGYLSFLTRERPFREILALVADPDAPNDYNPVELRAKELGRTDPSISPNRYREEGRDAIRSFYRWNSNSRCLLKTYQFPAVFRLVATERLMFLSFYPAIGRGKDNTVFCLPYTSPFYAMIARYFDHLWNDKRSNEPLQYSHAETGA